MVLTGGVALVLPQEQQTHVARSVAVLCGRVVGQVCTASTQPGPGPLSCWVSPWGGDVDPGCWMLDCIQPERSGCGGWLRNLWRAVHTRLMVEPARCHHCSSNSQRFVQDLLAG